MEIILPASKNLKYNIVNHWIILGFIKKIIEQRCKVVFFQDGPTRVEFTISSSSVIALPDINIAILTKINISLFQVVFVYLNVHEHESAIWLGCKRLNC